MAETDFTGGVKYRPRPSRAKVGDTLMVPMFQDPKIKSERQKVKTAAVAPRQTVKKTVAFQKAFAKLQQDLDARRIVEEEADLPHDMITGLTVRRGRATAATGVKRFDPSDGIATTQRKRAAKKKAATAHPVVVERPATQAFDIGKFFENLTKLGDHNEDIKLGALDHYYIPKIDMLLARLQVARDLAQQRRAALTNDGDELANMFASTRLGGKRRR